MHAPLRSGRRGFDIHDPAPDDLSRVSLHKTLRVQFAREQAIYEGRGVQPIAVREDCARGQPEGLYPKGACRACPAQANVVCNHARRADVEGMGVESAVWTYGSEVGEHLSARRVFARRGAETYALEVIWKISNPSDAVLTGRALQVLPVVSIHRKQTGK